jgi:hypothetical protein
MLVSTKPIHQVFKKKIHYIQRTRYLAAFHLFSGSGVNRLHRAARKLLNILERLGIRVSTLKLLFFVASTSPNTVIVNLLVRLCFHRRQRASAAI